MIPDDQALALHDRSTRGQPLSADERAMLERWYSEQDRAEMAARSSHSPESVADIQREIAVVLGQLTGISLQIKEIIAQNDAIRSENTVLRHQVAVRFAGEVA